MIYLFMLDLLCEKKNIRVGDMESVSIGNIKLEVDLKALNIV